MTVVIGVGNPDRGDDGAGRAVARRLRDVSPPGVDVRECEGEATALLAAWEGADEVVLVDACQGAGSPGSVHVFDATEIERLGSTPLRHASTHSFGLVAAVGLARALGRLPRRLVVYAIEGRRFREGAELSPEALQAVPKAVRKIRRLARLWAYQTQTRSAGSCRPSQLTGLGASIQPPPRQTSSS